MKSSHHIPTLRRLRDRLSDLSMRNRSLRLVRLPKKRAFDLAWLDAVHPGHSALVLERVLSGRRNKTALLAVGTDDEDAQALHRGLNYLHREVRLVEEERGVYDLSVGVVFLCGTVAEGKYIQAPVFLVPRRLVLDRKGRGGTRWTLDTIDDPKEVNVNRTLLLALQKHADLTLDLDRLEEAAAGVLFGKTRRAGWLQALTESVASTLQQQGLRTLPTTLVWGEGPDPIDIPDSQPVPALPLYKAAEMPTSPIRRFELRPHAVLSRFPLADTALLSDYDDLVQVLEVHPQQPLGYAGALLGDEDEVAAVSGRAPVQRESPRWHIESTDESQEDVLTQVLGGRSLAVYGPPGTGKSQLIANLVASALADDKRVLVVSQKRAALDVVAQRLGTDLERFTALVHDPVRDRSALVERVVASLAPELGHVGAANPSERERLLRTVGDHEQWFTGIHDALTRASPSGNTPFEAYVLKLRHPGKPDVLKVGKLPKTTPAGLRDALPDLIQLVQDNAWAREPKTWKRDRPDFGGRTQDDLDTFVDEWLPRVARAISRAQAWNDGRPELLAELEQTAADAGAYEALCAWCRASEPLDQVGWQWAAALAEQDQPSSAVSADRDLLHTLLEEREAVQGIPLSQQVDEVAADRVFAEYARTDSTWYCFLSPSWYDSKKQVGALLANEQIDTSDLSRGISLWRRRALYGRVLQETPGKLQALGVALVDLHALTRDLIDATVRAALQGARTVERWSALSPDARRLAVQMPRTAQECAALAKVAAYAVRALKLLKALQQSEKALQSWVGPHAGFWLAKARKQRSPDLVAQWFASQVEAHFDRLGAADRRIASTRERYPALSELAEDAARQGVVELKPELWRAYSERWIRDAERAGAILRDLDQGEAQRRRSQLREAWSEVPHANRRVLKAKLHDNVARISVRDRAELRKRAEQRRRRWPVRKLVETLWSRGLSDLLPVWLCSPETVAAVFPLTPGFFDFVVFDEASQCTLAQGLTAVYRGRTCVIAGDEQQLPPSNLFSTTLEDDDDLDQVIDEESLLSRAKSAGADMALTWHYRSRYPELIQFSNDAFYNGGLRVSPVPVKSFPSPALEWVRVDGDWTKRSNEEEGRIAAELLERYLKDHPDTSVGIITVNRSQSDYIQDLLDQRLEASPSFRTRYEEAMSRDLDARPFIRNLENVQGDERDVIILSVAYSADASGRVPLRFGALSQPGGERRLNVAVSRARRKMIVLCSFDPETQMVVSDQVSKGAQVLKDYLCYARRIGESDNSGSGAVAAPVPWAHAEAVDLLARELRGRGWQTDLAVGASAARVDLAVRSKAKPNRHVLGILLDGPGAGWAHSGVGREVGRATYLERYFWPIHHVSVRGLVRGGSEVLEQLITRIEAEEEKLDAVPPPPSVALPNKAAPRPKPAPSAPPIRRSPPRRGTPSAPHSTGPIARTVVSAPKAEPPAVVRQPTPEPGLVTAGCAVRFRNLDTEDEREVVLAGPSVPRGVDVVALNAPLADALIDGVAGEVVLMELCHKTVELEILEVRPPPPMAGI